jgi:hypothetical protein
MDTCQLTSPQGEAHGVSEGGMTLQALGGVNLPCGWYHVRGQLPSTGGQEHTQLMFSSATNYSGGGGTLQSSQQRPGS